MVFNLLLAGVYFRFLPMPNLVDNKTQDTLVVQLSTDNGLLPYYYSVKCYHTL